MKFDIYVLVFIGALGSRALAQTCSSIGGSCGATSACSNGLLVRRLCEGSSVCCTRPAGLTIAEIHTNVVEGYMYLTGYVPKTSARKSGVTIASGYDIGNGPDISGCVGSAIWSKLKPYRNYKDEASLNAAGIVASNLKVTFDEARKIDNCNIQLDRTNAKECSTSTSVCGSAVLISLAHWCGKDGLLFGGQNKCGGDAPSEKYMKSFCNRKGNDADLANSLNLLLAAHKRSGPEWKVTRIQQEIDFLKSCSK